MKIVVSHQFTPKTPSCRTAMVMDHFGIDFETGQYEIAPEFELPLEEEDVVCFTGPSGSGKSSLMRKVAEQLDDVLEINSLKLEEKPLIDLLEMPVPKGMALLSACGLGEGRLVLRTPFELSDGQRFRFRLALAFSKRPRWVMCDEFTATLDRKLALLIAGNLSRLSNRLEVGLLVATTHEDVVGELQPTLHVECRDSGEIVWSRSEGKKKGSIFPGGTGLRPAPNRIGRTLLVGIIGVITWGFVGMSL